MPPKAIPDRWIPYEPCGKVIEGTRIICFKVPLKLSVQKNVQEIKKIWDIPTLLAGIPKLSAVIDLTNTARYYNPQDFLRANIMHRKILMPGRVIPPQSSVRIFMNAVDEFLGKDGESLIGVHCTHGLNRTGYMVCRYMRDRLGIPAQEAIRRFENARGYKIERDIYINDILGHKQTTSVVKEVEVVPVDSRRNDVTYRSPLGDDSDAPTFDSRKRFGCSRSNNDRFGYNRISSVKTAKNSNSGGNNNGLFSCYTSRYKEINISGSKSRRDDKVRRPDRSPLSRRLKGESSKVSSRRNGNEPKREGRSKNDKDNKK